MTSNELISRLENHLGMHCLVMEPTDYRKILNFRTDCCVVIGEVTIEKETPDNDNWVVVGVSSFMPLSLRYLYEVDKTTKKVYNDELENENV